MADLEEMRGIEIRECGEPLETLDDKEFIIDPLYFHWGHSETDILQLRSGIIEKLRKAKEILQKMPGSSGWNFKIWDGYRTIRTQHHLYEDILNQFREKYPDWDEERLHTEAKNFISPPSQDPIVPAPHNTGGCVDLTLVNENGKELSMGTDFDDFTDKAHTDHFKNSKEGKVFHKNRMILKKVMEQAGFANYPFEWWHFSYGDQEWVRQTKADFAVYGSMELQ